MPNSTARISALVLGLVVIYAASSIAGAEGDSRPDPAALIAEALTLDADASIATVYDVTIADGKGNEAITTLSVFENQQDGRRAVVTHLLGSGKIDDTWFLSTAEPGGPPVLYVLKKGKAVEVRTKRWQTAIKPSLLWPVDFVADLPLAEPRIVSGVNMNGRESWLLAAELSGGKYKLKGGNLWIAKDDPRLLQINWLDKRGWPKRQRRIEYRQAENGANELVGEVIKPPVGGEWTRLVVTSRTVGEARSHEDFPPSLLTDRPALDALWP